jgi:hypothetical protein
MGVVGSNPVGRASSKALTIAQGLFILFAMAKALSTARFLALLSLRADLGKPKRVPDPLPKAKQIVISDWPARNSQLLLRLARALAGKDEVFSLRDVEKLDYETFSVALALTMAAMNGLYRKPDWQNAVKSMERAVAALARQ